MEELKEDLKVAIIEALNLEEINPSDINDEEPLFGEGLGLDSIDALELIVLLEKKYGVKVENPEDGRDIFRSVNTIAAFIEKNRK